MPVAIVVGPARPNVTANDRVVIVPPSILRNTNLPGRFLEMLAKCWSISNGRFCGSFIAVQQIKLRGTLHILLSIRKDFVETRRKIYVKSNVVFEWFCEKQMKKTRRRKKKSLLLVFKTLVLIRILSFSIRICSKSLLFTVSKELILRSLIVFILPPSAAGRFPVGLRRAKQVKCPSAVPASWTMNNRRPTLHGETKPNQVVP